jgi:hypothetical protein
LETWLAKNVFAADSGMNVKPDAKDVKGFKTFMKLYIDGLNIERAAVEYLK